MRSRTPINFVLETCVRTPDLIPVLNKTLIRKHILADLDYKRGDGKASRPPVQISLRITNACNHRCAVCGQFGEKGYIHTEDGKKLLKTMPLQKYKEIVDEVSRYKPIFYVTGGEAFLYPHLVELMNYIKHKGCTVSVVTNGVRLKESAEQIVRNGWDMILVSLDGPKKVHDQCRGLPGAYKAAVNGLFELRRWKRKLRKSKPYILTSTTISKVNAPVLDKTFTICNRIKPDVMVVYLSWFTTEKIGQQHTQIIEKALGIKPYTWKSYVNRFNEIDLDLFVSAVEKVRKKRWNFKSMFIPDLRLNDMKDYYLKPSEMFGYSKCIAPFIMVDIMPNGDVTTCRDFIDIKVGNVNDNKLLDIWNNDKFVQFRKLLIKHKGLLPICARCCGLMGF
ncbi:MAG: radical SAM protein [Elusimicrobiota bacterium]